MIWYTLTELLPPIYRQIKAMFATADAENAELLELAGDSEAVQDNFFVQTCDAQTLAYYESLLRLVPYDESNIDARRADVLAAMSNVTRYTMPYLMERLNEIFGLGNWDAYVEQVENPAMGGGGDTGPKLYISVRNPFGGTIYRLNGVLNQILPCHVLRDISENVAVNADVCPNAAAMCGITYNAVCAV